MAGDDGTVKNNQNQNICLAFTVEDIEKAYEKVLALGARIIEAPTKRPWGAVNMSFYDPDNNVIYLRQFANKWECNKTGKCFHVLATLSCATS